MEVSDVWGFCFGTDFDGFVSRSLWIILLDQLILKQISSWILLMRLFRLWIGLQLVRHFGYCSNASNPKWNWNACVEIYSKLHRNLRTNMRPCCNMAITTAPWHETNNDSQLETFSIEKILLLACCGCGAGSNSMHRTSRHQIDTISVWWSIHASRAWCALHRRNKLIAARLNTKRPNTHAEVFLLRTGFFVPAPHRHKSTYHKNLEKYETILWLPQNFSFFPAWFFFVSFNISLFRYIPMFSLMTKSMSKFIVIGWLFL